MKLIKASFEIIEQQGGLKGVYKHIEMAGRTCYKSEDKITEDSAEGFVNRMIKSGHGAMLEHGTIYLQMPTEFNKGPYEYYLSNPYSKVNIKDKVAYITTNSRVIVENDWHADLKYMCMPAKYHEKRVTVKFITDQGILREFTRHRVFSFAVESTRYCNYSRDKFNNEITYIYPCWLSDEDNSADAEEVFKYALIKAEQYYFRLLKEGWKPQQARNVLPLSTKCEMIMTGFVSDWKHFFFLRDDNAAHPQARELASPLHQEFKHRGYL